MNPTHADSRCTIGFRNTVPPFSGLWKKKIKVKAMKKMIEHEMAAIINTGVGTAGAERTRFAALSGRVVKSGMGRHQIRWESSMEDVMWITYYTLAN